MARVETFVPSVTTATTYPELLTLLISPTSMRRVLRPDGGHAYVNGAHIAQEISAEMFDDSNAGEPPADTALPTKMIKAKTCAAMLDIHVSTVHRRLTAGKLRGKKVSARLTLIYLDSVTEYLNSCPDR
jgi:hypothetical protein